MFVRYVNHGPAGLRDPTEAPTRPVTVDGFWMDRRAVTNREFERFVRKTRRRPVVELLDYLAAHGVSSSIASCGGRDFMRPISPDVYGIPRERVIGSSAALDYTGAEQARDQAARDGRTVVSVKDDWATVS